MSTVRHNTDELTRKMRRFERALEDELARMAGPIFSRVAARSVGSYMRDAKGESELRSRSDDGPLRIVKGRLARSLTGASTAGVGSEAVRRIELRGATLRLRQGSRTPYAAAQEFGARIRVTPAMRSYFWARFYETDDERYKAMALSPKSVFEIEPRPFLGPALDDERGWIQQYAEGRVTAMMRKVFS